MSWAGSDPLDLYLGTRAVMLARGASAEAAHATEGWPASQQCLARVVEALPRQVTVRVWLSGALCRPFVMPAPAGLKTEDERRRAMEAFAQRACGFDGPVRVQWQEARKDRPIIGMAMDAAMLAHIKAGLARLRVRMLTPWWMAALNHQLKQAPDTACIAVQDCDALTMLTGEAACFSQASTLAPSHDASMAMAGYRRLQLAMGTLTGSVAPLYVLAVPGATPAGEQIHDGLAMSPFARKEP